MTLLTKTILSSAASIALGIALVSAAPGLRLRRR